MIKTVAVDTNVLLDYRFKRKPGVDKARQLFEECLAKKSKIFIPNIVFPEVEWVLRSFYKQQKTVIVEFFDNLLDLEGIIMDDKALMEEALNIFKQSSLRLTDAIILVQINKFQPNEFLTSDENLKKFYQANFRS